MPLIVPFAGAETIEITLREVDGFGFVYPSALFSLLAGDLSRTHEDPPAAG